MRATPAMAEGTASVKHAGEAEKDTAAKPEERWSPRCMARPGAGAKRCCKPRPGIELRYRLQKANKHSMSCHQRAGADQRLCREKANKIDVPPQRSSNEVLRS